MTYNKQYPSLREIAFFDDIRENTKRFIENTQEHERFMEWVRTKCIELEEGQSDMITEYVATDAYFAIVERWQMEIKYEAGIETQVEKLHKLSEKIRECLLNKAPIEKTHDLRGQWLRIYWHLPSPVMKKVVEKTVYEDLQAGCIHWFPRLGTKFSESYIERIRAKFGGQR